jgi:hypothetical protein
MKKYYYLSIAVLSVIFITGISLVFAQSWEAPTQDPPFGNAVAPINTSDVSQTKEGILWAVDLFTSGTVYADQAIFAPNTIESTDNTKILTIDSTGGGFEWREAGPWAAGGGSSSFGNYERVEGPVALGSVGSIATCSPGNKVIGGGCEATWGGDPHLMFGYNYPDTDTSFSCSNLGDGADADIQAFAICVSGI